MIFQRELILLQFQPQLMPSVEKRKVEIIRDQMKHLDAAERREKMKYADFEFVSAIPDHLQVKGSLEFKRLYKAGCLSDDHSYIFKSREFF